jgi:hypothetical protein
MAVNMLDAKNQTANIAPVHATLNPMPIIIEKVNNPIRLNIFIPLKSY